MGEAIELRAVRDADGGGSLGIHVRDAALAGKKATVRIEHVATVKRSNPVHNTTLVLEREIVLRAGEQSVDLGHALADTFAYAGDELDLGAKARLTVDDGVFFDTKLEADLGGLGRLPPRLEACREGKSVHSPRDRFDFIANLRAIPAQARAIVLGLLLVGGPVVLANALVGARDQMVPESQVWFYDHTGEDGGESPLLKALGGSGAAGLALWLAIRRQLQKYMRFEARWPLGTLACDSRCRASEVISGEAGVLLEQAVVRLVAYNREHGQHRVQEGSGKNRRTVTKDFTNDARGVVLYERLLPHLPAGQRLEAHLDDEIDFGPVFSTLYPPCRYGGSHGLSIQLEAQLLHPEYVDHDVPLDPGGIDDRGFHGPGVSNA